MPALAVSINGKTGRFYLQPELDSNMGDGIAAFDPVYSHADAVFDFPGSYLHQGSNTITLQAIEESKTFVPDASLTYDAIELDTSPVDFHPQSSTAQILPTIFYQQRQGKLDEIVDLLIRYDEQPKPGSSADLVMAGKHYRQELQGKRDFGEEKLEFAVPEFPAQTRAQLAWSVDGKVQHQAVTVTPQKKWTLFLVPHVHLDVGYTDYQAKVAAIQSRIIDEAMGLTAKYPDFRFSIDGEWNLEQFLKPRTPAEQQRAITAIQKQQLFVPAQYANLLTGFPTAETLIRSLYPSVNFSREHETPLNYANITDVPSYSWSYASILASAGIKYLLAGSKVDTKEAVYFAFPFAMKQPQFQYEIQTGVVDPAKNMYPGAGHEWFSVQHRVSVQQDGISATVMPLDASLVTLGDINRGAWPTQFGERPGTIFSYAMNNYWHTNYRAGQGGHFCFRYVITSAPSTRPAELSRMGWEEMTPFEQDEVTSQDKALNLPRPLDGKQGSFFDVRDTNLLLDTWKPSEDGQGTILRFLDLRRSHIVLQTGEEQVLRADSDLLVYVRGYVLQQGCTAGADGKRVLVVVNKGNQAETFTIPTDHTALEHCAMKETLWGKDASFQVEGNAVRMIVPAGASAIAEFD